MTKKLIKLYRIHFEQTNAHWIEVVAKNEEDAVEKARLYDEFPIIGEIEEIK